MSTYLKYRERERQRKRESRRQAREAQRTKDRERFRVRDKKKTKQNKGDIFWLEEQHENFVAAVTKGEKVAVTQCENERQ